MLYELLKSRRSIRKFQDREVEKDKMDILLKSALLAPSSRSRRPWEFIAVTDKELLKKLSKAREHSSSFIENAPLGIVVVADPEKCDVWIEDASIASIIIQLTAQSLGLGSCWIQIRERFHSGNLKAEDYVKEVLGIPSNYNVECMIAVGYPAEAKSAYSEDDLMYEKLHYNKY
ncbi:nitroreductase family protein [Acetivibrio clariflavus]|uniref:Nitroreductase n=1 Tax=Acetivibrio clariflavus (strain DSM 19732 / NBRC 101661 / EBR45) TaxID=720554 RepID=G8LTG1_ACECE|nr:nitroreductase family protein [Acetivibrio clariflavus]AEV69456.1 nitroreductase [Acetivibrio clariflavus DSM 19732]HOQ01791.1 nitroreductase family protein [Acetivibrio clariflavus]